MGVAIAGQGQEKVARGAVRPRGARVKVIIRD